MNYFGLYRATVEDNDDPGKLCRLKLRVLSLYQNLGIEDLPWAYPAFALGGTANVGSVFIPPVGSTVWAAFEEGNANIPIWLGAYYGMPGGQSETPSVFRGVAGQDPATIDAEPLISEPSSWKAQYPKNSGIRTPGGIVIEYDDTPGGRRIHLFHPSGSHMEFRENGDVVLHVVGNYHVVVDGEVKELYKQNHEQVIALDQQKQIGQNRFENIGGNDSLTVIGNVLETILATYTRTITGLAQDTCLANFMQNILGQLLVQAGGKSENISGDSVSISTGQVTIGGSQVNINP